MKEKGNYGKDVPIINCTKPFSIPNPQNQRSVNFLCVYHRTKMNEEYLKSQLNVYYIVPHSIRAQKTHHCNLQLTKKHGWYRETHRLLQFCREVWAPNWKWRTQNDCIQLIKPFQIVRGVGTTTKQACFLTLTHNTIFSKNYHFYFPSKQTNTNRSKTYPKQKKMESAFTVKYKQWSY